jgi:hypothetical protein
MAYTEKALNMTSVWRLNNILLNTMLVVQQIEVQSGPNC